MQLLSGVDYDVRWECGYLFPPMSRCIGNSMLKECAARFGTKVSGNKFKASSCLKGSRSGTIFIIPKQLFSMIDRVCQ